MSIRRLARGLAPALIVLAVAAGPAHGAWLAPVAGTNPLGGGDVTSGGSAEVVRAADGTLWSAWGENPVGPTFPIRAARLTPGAAAWATFPTFGHVTTSDGAGAKVRLALVGSTPFVAYADPDVGKIVVRSFDGNVFTQVGADIGSADSIRPSITVHGGVPFVAYSDAGLDIKVVKLAGNVWTPVGGQIDDVDTQTAALPTIASIGGNLYVAWIESPPSGDVLYVKMLTNNGATWGDASNDDFGPLNRDGDVAANPTDPELFAYGANRVGLVWLENGAMRFDHLSGESSGSPTWAAGEDLELATPIVIARPHDLAGQPGVAVSYGANEAFNVVVGQLFRLNSSTQDWDRIGPPPNNDRETTSYLTDFAGGGAAPVASYLEFEQPGGFVRWKVARLLPEVLTTSSTPADTRATLVTKVKTFGFPFLIGRELGTSLAFGTPAGSEQTLEGEQQDTLTFDIGGLAAATGYSWRNLVSEGAQRVFTGPVATFTTLAPSGPGQQGDKGDAGAPGGAGAQGPPGVQGPAGKDAPLLVALAAAKFRQRAGKLTLPFVVTEPSTVALTIVKGSTTVFSTSKAVSGGKGSLVWNGKVKRKLVKGVFQARVTATARGRTATDAAAIRMR